jgi:hypothetical protein
MIKFLLVIMLIAAFIGCTGNKVNVTNITNTITVIDQSPYVTLCGTWQDVLGYEAIEFRLDIDTSVTINQPSGALTYRINNDTLKVIDNNNASINFSESFILTFTSTATMTLKHISGYKNFSSLLPTDTATIWSFFKL